MTGNKHVRAVTLIALTMASTTVLAEQKYRFPPMEEQNVAASQPYPNGPQTVVLKKKNIEPELAPPASQKPSPQIESPKVPTRTVKSYPRAIPPGAIPPVARPYAGVNPNYRAPLNYRPPSNYQVPPNYAAPNRAPLNYRVPRPYTAPYGMNRPIVNRAPYPYRAPYGAPPPNYRTPGTPPAYGAMPPPNYPPMAGPYRPNSGGPWNRSFGNRSFNNRSFGRNFFDRGPFKNGPFGGKSAPWEYDEDDNFGFFDMIPSDELEEIWDEMIAGPEDGDIPGPMNWPSIEMPGPFEVGEQVEDVMYEIPSFFGDGYGYDSEYDD